MSIARSPRLWCGLSVLGIVTGLTVAGSAVVTGGFDGRGESEGCTFNEFDAPIHIDVMSPNGKYIAGEPSDWRSDAGTGIWHDGRYSELEIGDDRGFGVIDINDSGDMVGNGWRLIDGEFQRLKAPDGSSEAIPEAIGADGTVVGWTGEEAAPKPVKWRPDSTAAATLDTGDHDNGKAVDIAADGSIIGSVGDGDWTPGTQGRAYDAWRWDADGNGRKITDRKTTPSWGGQEIQVAGMSEALYIAGDWVLVTADGVMRRVNLNDPDNLQGIKLDYRNKHDLVVLDKSGRAYGSKKDEPAVYDDGVTTLPGLPTPPPDTQEENYSNKLLAVSADGSRIAGTDWHGNPVLWICDGSSLPKTVKAPADPVETEDPPTDPKACEVKALTAPEGKDYATEAYVSPDGSYVAMGIAHLSEDKSDSFGLWHDGKYTEVDGVPEIGNVNVAGVNNSGMVIGESNDPGDGDGFAAWRYQDGEVQILDMPSDAPYGNVNAIAEDGTVVGDFSDGAGGSGPLMWRPGDSTPTALDNGGHKEVTARDISDSGIIVGSRPEKKDYSPKAWMWDTDGNSVPLPNMTTEDYYRGSALAVAGDWVLLFAERESDHAYYRYNLKDKGDPEEVKLTGANDIDEQGRVYGANGSALSVYDDDLVDQPGINDGSEKGPAMGAEINSAAADGSVFAGHSGDKPTLWTCGLDLAACRGSAMYSTLTLDDRNLRRHGPVRAGNTVLSSPAAWPRSRGHAARPSPRRAAAKAVRQSDAAQAERRTSAPTPFGSK